MFNLDQFRTTQLTLLKVSVIYKHDPKESTSAVLESKLLFATLCFNAGWSSHELAMAKIQDEINSPLPKTP